MSSNPPTRKPLKQQPRNTTRKSKEEREAIAREEEERQKQRTEAAKAEATELATRQRMQYGSSYNTSDRNIAARRREFSHGRGTRGGFMGAHDLQQRRKAIAEGQAERRNEANQSVRHMSRISRSGERSSRSRAKTTPRNISESDVEVISDLKVKSEPEDEPDLIDLDDEFGGPRKNIEHINLVSSDESEEEDLQSDGRHVNGEALPLRQTPRRGLDMVPIRLNRREHVDRVAGINTEASSIAAVESRRTASDGKFVNATADPSVSVKGKRRSIEVELLSEGRRWKGVYEDEEEVAKMPPSRIKKESKSPTLKRSAGATAAEVDIPVEDIGSSEPVNLETTIAAEEQKAAQDKPKAKQRKAGEYRGGKAHTTLTEEHKREDELYRQELKILRDELGRQALGLTSTQEPASSTFLEAELRDDKADNIYLFQLPPVVPNLFNPANIVKPELEQSQETNSLAEPASTTGYVNKQETIKIEDDGADAYQRGNEGNTRGPKLTSGKAGKLQVHRSGRVTLSWGGTCMEVKLGTSVSFLQTAVLVDDRNEDGPLATSVGNLRGRFVVCPDWNEILS